MPFNSTMELPVIVPETTLKVIVSDAAIVGPAIQTDTEPVDPEPTPATVPSDLHIRPCVSDGAIIHDKVLLHPMPKASVLPARELTLKVTEIFPLDIAALRTRLGALVNTANSAPKVPALEFAKDSPSLLVELANRVALAIGGEVKPMQLPEVIHVQEDGRAGIVLPPLAPSGPINARANSLTCVVTGGDIENIAVCPLATATVEFPEVSKPSANVP